MTFEARVAFVVFFFLVWCLIGLIPWAIAAVISRGRGALPALPIALAGAAFAGVMVPVLGQRDVTGFLLSLLAALIGGAIASFAAILLTRRISTSRHASAPSETRSTVDVSDNGD